MTSRESGNVTGSPIHQSSCYLGSGPSELVKNVSLVFTVKLIDVSQFGVLEKKKKRDKILGLLLSTGCITSLGFFTVCLPKVSVALPRISFFLYPSHRFAALPAHPSKHTHTASQTGVTLPPWGRATCNCSSALFSVFCRRRIKGEVERWKKQAGR